MATEYIKKVTDDIDGSTESVSTRAFSVDGRSYEIDLSIKNNARFDSDLDKYIQHARSGSQKRPTMPAGIKQRKSGGSSGYNSEQLAAIRDWARRNGHQVSPKGRIAADIIAAFEADMTPAEPSRIFSET